MQMLIKNSQIFIRKLSSFCLLVFFTATSFASPSYAVINERMPNIKSNAKVFSPLTVRVPESIGKIQESFRGANEKTIILIQDAHGIPDAQRNIAKLIEYFQSEYGINNVALEGVPTDLNPQIFKSFPEKELLRKQFEIYLENGEMSGGGIAALFSPHASVYSGVEDWKLYEQGLALYQQTMGQEQEIQKGLDSEEETIRKRKKIVYSAKLLEIDQELEKFYGKQADFLETLQALAEVKAPEKDSELDLVLKQANQDFKSQGSEEIDIKNIAKNLKKSLTQDQERMFNQKYQEFLTSRISTREFAACLKSFSPHMTGQLLDLADSHQKVQAIQGTKFFTDFERYAQSVKESLFRSEKERDLDLKSERLKTLGRLNKLELSYGDWVELKSLEMNQKTRRKFSAHFQFYQVASKRDDVFFEKLNRLMEQRRFQTVMFVVGGFHTEKLAEKFKQKGISYVLLAPEIASLPAQNHYREHMRGDVSWKEYYQVENGKVNLYKAFVRGARDLLLAKSKDRDILKKWRDRILIDLAVAGKITDASQYTLFLDEAAFGKQKGLRPAWRVRLNQFIEKIEKLKTQNQLTQQNILPLLVQSTQPDPSAVGFGKDVSIPASLVEAVDPTHLDLREIASSESSRSEVRSSQGMPRVNEISLSESLIRFARTADLRALLHPPIPENPTAEDFQNTFFVGSHADSLRGLAQEALRDSSINQEKLRALGEQGIINFWRVLRLFDLYLQIAGQSNEQGESYADKVQEMIRDFLRMRLIRDLLSSSDNAVFNQNVQTSLQNVFSSNKAPGSHPSFFPILVLFAVTEGIVDNYTRDGKNDVDLDEVLIDYEGFRSQQLADLLLLAANYYRIFRSYAYSDWQHGVHTITKFKGGNRDNFWPNDRQRIEPLHQFFEKLSEDKTQLSKRLGDPQPPLAVIQRRTYAAAVQLAQGIRTGVSSGAIAAAFENFRQTVVSKMYSNSNDDLFLAQIINNIGMARSVADVLTNVQQGLFIVNKWTVPAGYFINTDFGESKYVSVLQNLASGPVVAYRFVRAPDNEYFLQVYVDAIVLFETGEEGPDGVLRGYFGYNQRNFAAKLRVIENVGGHVTARRGVVESKTLIYLTPVFLPPAIVEAPAADREAYIGRVANHEAQHHLDNLSGHLDSELELIWSRLPRDNSFQDNKLAKITAVGGKRVILDELAAAFREALTNYRIHLRFWPKQGPYEIAGSILRQLIPDEIDDAERNQILREKFQAIFGVPIQPIEDQVLISPVYGGNLREAIDKMEDLHRRKPAAATRPANFDDILSRVGVVGRVASVGPPGQPFTPVLPEYTAVGSGSNVDNRPGGKGEKVKVRRRLSIDVSDPIAGLGEDGNVAEANFSWTPGPVKRAAQAQSDGAATGTEPPPIKSADTTEGPDQAQVELAGQLKKAVGEKITAPQKEKIVVIIDSVLALNESSAVLNIIATILPELLPSTREINEEAVWEVFSRLQIVFRELDQQDESERLELFTRLQTSLRRLKESVIYSLSGVLVQALSQRVIAEAIYSLSELLSSRVRSSNINPLGAEERVKIFSDMVKLWIADSASIIGLAEAFDALNKMVEEGFFNNNGALRASILLEEMNLHFNASGSRAYFIDVAAGWKSRPKDAIYVTEEAIRTFFRSIPHRSELRNAAGLSESTLPPVAQTVIDFMRGTDILAERLPGVSFAIAQHPDEFVQTVVVKADELMLQEQTATVTTSIKDSKRLQGIAQFVNLNFVISTEMVKQGVNSAELTKKVLETAYQLALNPHISVTITDATGLELLKEIPLSVNKADGVRVLSSPGEVRLAREPIISSQNETIVVNVSPQVKPGEWGIDPLQFQKGKPDYSHDPELGSQFLVSAAALGGAIALKQQPSDFLVSTQNPQIFLVKSPDDLSGWTSIIMADIRSSQAAEQAA